MLLTLGYERRSAGQLRELLGEHGVSVLVDVRLTPRSRKPGLSRGALAAAVGEVGIDYRHRRGLGNPRDNRAGFGHPGAPRQQARERYRARLLEEGREALDEVARLAARTRVALLCYERDPAGCHRAVIAEEVRGLEPSVDVRHLA